MQETKTHRQEITDALTWECTAAPTNPNMEQDPKHPMAHWHVVVSNKDGQQMDFHYSMGSGLCEQWLSKRGAGKAALAGSYRYILRIEGPHYFTPKRLIEHAQERKMKPSNDDMALCLCNMALDGPASFRDFCADFDYDDDSIKARNTWETCLKQQQDLLDIFPQSTDWWADAREEIDQ